MQCPNKDTTSLMKHSSQGIFLHNFFRLCCIFIFIQFKKFSFFLLFFFSFFGCTACGILVPQPGAEPATPAVEIRSLLGFLEYLFIYLVAPGLSCGRQPPQLWHVNSQLWHACGIQFPDQGSNSGPLHWERRVLTTAPPAKSPIKAFLKFTYSDY